MKRNGLSLLLVLIIQLTACIPIQQENPIFSTHTIEGTQTVIPEKTNQELPKDITENPQSVNLPVTVSFVKNQWSSDAEIITIDVTGNINYAAIPVMSQTVLKSLPAIDQEGNVYLLYGRYYSEKTTFFSKLGINGSIETINVPVIDTSNNTVWIGNRLFINGRKLFIVSTDMSIDEQPAMNRLPDGSSDVGFMGLANETEKSLVWFALRPLREEGKVYAFYRTYNVNNGETHEGKLEVPSSTVDFNPTGNPLDRLGTLVMGVDTASKHVLLCYSQVEDANTGYFVLELYDASKGEMVTSEKTCCLNTYIISSGPFYSSNEPIESCGFDIIRRYSDGSDVLNFPTKASVNPNLWHWNGTNGDYWILMDHEKLSILDNLGNQLYEYNMPEESFNDCYPSECISPGFLISQE